MAGKPIGSFYVSLGLNTKEFSQKIKLANRELENAFGNSAIRTSETLAYAVAGLAIAITGVGAAAVKMAADLEVQEKSFERLLGGVDKATAKLNELKEFASKTPFTFTEVVDASKKLLALGFSAQELIPTLTMVGDAASGLGLNTEGLNRIIKAFGDIRSKGILSTQEIKQLAEAGIPAFEILAQKLGVEMPEAIKMVEDRAVSSATAIAAFTSGINERFGGMMAIQAETMLGMWSTVRDEGENVLRILGKKITQSTELHRVMESIRKSATDFRLALENQGFQAAFDSIFGMKAKIAIGAVAGAVTALLIPAIIKLGIAFAAASLPFKVIAGFAVLAGGLAGALNSIGSSYKSTINVIKDATATAITWVSNKISIAIKEIFFSIEKAIGVLAQSFATAAKNHGFREMAEELQGYADSMQRLASEDSANAQLLRNQNEVLSARLSTLYDVYKTSTDWIDLMNGAGAGNIVAVYDRIGMSISGMVRSMLEAIRLTSLWANITGQGTNAKASPSGSAPKAGKADDKNRLLDQAKQTSQSIESEWYNQVAGRAAQLEQQYKKELAALNESKALNKNYRRDLFMLDEIYYQQRVELMRDTADKEIAKQLEIAESRQAYSRQQMEEDNEAAERKYELIAALQEVGAKEFELAEARRINDYDQFVQLLNDKTAAERSYFEARGEMISFYEQLQADANRSQISKTTEAYRTFYDGMTSALTDFSGGLKGIGERIKDLGLQMIQMVVKWQVQQKLAHIMGESMRAASTAASITQAATLAAAWAPAAAFANAATFGGASGAASSMMSLARGLSPVPFAEGGIVTRPTLAMIGEGGEREAVIPLSKLENMTGGAGGGVVVNLINQSGVPMTARSSQRMDGRKMVVDLWLSGLSENVSGIQDVLGRR